MDFFFSQPSKVSKREAKGSYAYLAVHIVQANIFLLPHLFSASDFSMYNPRIYLKTSNGFFHHLRTSHLADHIGESLKSGAEMTQSFPVPEVRNLGLFSSERASE